MDRESRFDEVLADWCDRRDRGEAAPPSEVIEANPELAEELKSFFATVRFVDLALTGGPELPAGAPKQIGEFRIIREVGRVRSPAVTGIGESVERFQREARAAGKLHHTNIVPVYGMGEDRGFWYFAMEMVEGRSLGEVIDEMREQSRGANGSGNGNGKKRPVSISRSTER